MAGKKELEGKNKNEKFDIKEIYTPLSVAKKEIWRRWNDKKLRKKVEDFLGGDVPDFLKKEPRAYLPRHIASPNFECVRFFELSKKINLKPVIPEFKNDKFIVINPVKYYLANLRIENKGSVEVLKIVNEDYFNGKKFCDTETLWGEKLIEFHHKIFKDSFDKENRIIFDISDWFNVNGRKSDKFYIYFLSLFVRNAVLFENYLDSGEEGEMVKNIVSPAFYEIEKIFGCKPLIVRLLPEESEKELHWYSYQDKIKINLKKYGL